MNCKRRIGYEMGNEIYGIKQLFSKPTYQEEDEEDKPLFFTSTITMTN